MKVVIDKETVSQMPVVEYTGRIHVIDSMLHVRPAVAALRKEPLVGFDTETKPNFRKGRPHKVALIQLATHNDCFLFRVNKIGVPAALKDYLADPQCKKVGLSLHDDFHQLKGVGVENPGGFYDLQDIVGEYRIAELGLRKIYAVLFGEKISKGQQLTNWEADQLTPSQQRYGAIDAWACLRIFEYLASGNFDPMASPYLTDTGDEEDDESNTTNSKQAQS